jgi:HTH-type transcriptional regulator/antitoxin HigA
VIGIGRCDSAKQILEADMDIRPIKSEADYRWALGRIDVLIAGDREPEEGTPEADELEVLVTLVQVYEAKHYPIGSPDPITAIKFRMDQGDLTRKDLEPALGSESRVSEILNKRRPLTLAMIRRLHEMFDIPLESLVTEYETA